MTSVLEAAVAAAEAELRRIALLQANLEQAVAEAEDAVDVATSRLVLARIDAGEETVIPWDQALADLADN